MPAKPFFNRIFTSGSPLLNQLIIVWFWIPPPLLVTSKSHAFAPCARSLSIAFSTSTCCLYVPESTHSRHVM